MPLPARAAAVLSALVLLAVPAACSDGDRGAAGPTTTSAAAGGGAGTTTTSAAPGGGAGTTWPTSAFPPAREDLEHGGSTWAVVLAGAREAEAPALVEAEAAAARAGYVTGPTDCDRDAPEALGLAGEPPTFTVSVYFRTQEESRRGLDAFHAHGFRGGAVAQVETYCLD